MRPSEEMTQRSETPQRAETPPKKRPPRRQRGVALIAVSAAIAMAAVVVAEFSTNTTIDMFSAANTEADMQAHFLSRSAMNLSELVIEVQTGIIDPMVNKPYKMDIQFGDYIGLFMGAFGGSKEEVESLAALVGGFEADSLRGLGVPAGSFDVQLTTEDGKINLNCANTSGTGSEQQTLSAQLQALFYDNAYNPIFENEDAEGWRRTRDIQVEAIVDFIDRDTSRFDSREGRTIPGASEEYGYENLSDKYQVKNNYLDTIGEIKLIRGIDDRMWNLFGKHFTVYGGCKINLGAVTSADQYYWILLLAAREDDPVARDPRKLWALARYIAEMRALGITFSSAKDLVDFAREPGGGLESLAGQQSGDGQSQQPETPIPDGIELDQKKLDTMVEGGPRITYRVEATAYYGKLQKRVVGVWDTRVIRLNQRQSQNSGSSKGAWVFWREE